MLDLIDKKLLLALDKNARQPLSRIAKELRINRNVALYRMNRLKQEGVVKGSFVELNNTALGYINFRMFFKLGNYGKTEYASFMDFLSKYKNLMWLSKVVGKWDVDLVYLAQTVAEFEEFRAELFTKYNALIEDSRIDILTNIIHYPKDYLLNSGNKTRDFTQLKVGATKEWDELDFKLLVELTKDAMLNVLELGKRLGVSVKTIVRRMKTLEKKGIILGYRLFIDIQKAGYEYYKLHLSLRNYLKADKEKLQVWLARKNTVVYIDHYINGEDFEIELHLRNDEEYVRFWNALAEEFGTIIKEHYFFKFQEVSVFKYLPS